MRERITAETSRPAVTSAKLLAAGLKSGKYRLEAGEAVGRFDLLKRCSECGEYWPATTEYFWRSKVGDLLFNRCKACYHQLSKLVAAIQMKRPRSIVDPVDRA
jgi:hypothetical protein